MDIRTFLGRVMPPEGNGGYVLTLIKDKKAWNQGTYATLDEIANAAVSFDRSEWSVYFAVGTHKDNVVGGKFKRTRDTAYKFKSLCVDIDVGPDKPYKTQKDAYRALVLVTGILSLPDPIINSSGSGLHVYWPLTAVLSKANWEKTSILLRRALESQGLQIDPSKIHDPSMVLRPVETTHKKDPTNLRQVRTLKDAPDTDTLEIVTKLRAVASLEGIPIPNAPKKAPAGSLIGNVLNTTYTPLNLVQIAAGCAQIGAMVADGGAACDYNMWVGAIGVAKNCEDVHAAIITLCGNGKNFRLGEGEQKIATLGEGTTTCAYFKKYNASGCAGCAHEGKEKFNPGKLSLGVTVAIVAEVEVKPPPPYLIKNDMVYREFTNTKTVKDADGKKTEVEFQDTELVSPYLIFPESRYTDVSHDTTVVSIKAKYPIVGWRNFDLPMATLSAGGIDFAKVLGDKQIIISNDTILKRLRVYLMSYLQQLQQYADTSYKFDHFGWQPDGTFLSGHTLVGDKQNRDFMLTGSADLYATHMQTNGTLDNWITATSVYTRPDTQLHAAFFLMGAGSPILAGSQISSCLLHLYSPDSGTGKTVTQNMVMSMYGNPQKLIMSSRDTDNAVYGVFGTLKNLTPCMDEMTLVIRDDLNRAYGMAYNGTSGTEKTSMDKNRNIRDRSDWQMMQMWSSNSDFEGLLELRADSDAVRQRMIQGYFAKNEFFTKHGRKLNMLLCDNYGHAMTPFVEEIIKQGGKRAVYERTYDLFEKKYKFQFDGTERFIHAAVVCGEAAGQIMEDAGLIKFRREKPMERLLREIEAKRKQTTRAVKDSMDLMSQYWLERNRSIVECIEEISTPGSRMKVKLPTPDTAMVRYEVQRDKGVAVDGVIHCNRTDLRKWLQDNGSDLDTTLRGLTQLGVQYKDNERVSIMKGCEKSNPGQTYCLSISLNHPRILTVLSQPTAPVQLTSNVLQIRKP